VIYINPEMGLQYGPKVTLIRDKGPHIVVPVPRFLLSGEQKERLRKAAEKEKEELARRPAGIYGLLQDDDD